MPHDIASSGEERRLGIIENIPAHWRHPLLRLAIICACLFALTFRDWWAMADQWWNISTYNHVLFVPPIVGWLIYIRRDQLAPLVPTGWWPGLIAFGGALFVWLLGTLAGVNSVSQFGTVIALQSAILAVLGPRIAAACFFPLAYLIFLVPFGEEMVPLLQMVTAKLVIIFTEWSGITAVIDGVFIDTPAGLFEVAEACSGVKFLIAMVALGLLVSYTCFRSFSRRVMFMAGAIILPIVANGVRAWGTIFIAQSEGVEFAVGFDHIFYGWVFFALVVAMLLAVSWRWFDRDPDDVGIDFPEIEKHNWFAFIRKGEMNANKTAGFMLVIIGITALWSVFAARVEASVPPQVSFPEVAGWTLVDYEPSVMWEPKATGADHRLLGRYRSDTGQEVDVFFALYSAQEEGREASAFGEGALTPDTHWRWLEPGNSTAEAAADYLLAFGKQKRLVETSYRVGDLLTGSAARLKIANMRDRLLLREAPTMLLILSSEKTGNSDPASDINSFRKSLGDEGEWMDRIAGLG